MQRPLLCTEELNGGYNVHPKVGPESANNLAVINSSELATTQRARLFTRGKIMSCARQILGSIKFPKLLMSTGITIKKIILIAWRVVIAMEETIMHSGDANVLRMTALNDQPNSPPDVPRSR